MQIISSLHVCALWIVMEMAYLSRFVFPLVETVLSYGKLKATTTSKQDGKSLWSKLLTRIGIKEQIHWTGMYLFANAFHICLNFYNFANITCLLFQLQVARRLYECLLVHVFSDTIVTWPQVLSGLFYYAMASTSIFVSNSNDQQQAWYMLLLVVALFLYARYNVQMIFTKFVILACINMRVMPFWPSCEHKVMHNKKRNILYLLVIGSIMYHVHTTWQKF